MYEVFQALHAWHNHIIIVYKQLKFGDEAIHVIILLATCIGCNVHVLHAKDQNITAFERLLQISMVECIEHHSHNDTAWYHTVNTQSYNIIMCNLWPLILESYKSHDPTRRILMLWTYGWVLTLYKVYVIFLHVGVGDINIQFVALVAST